MEVDEALWRSFLAAHFGRGSLDPSEKAQSAGEFLCAFGTSPYWTWMRVSSDIHSFRSWLIKNSERLKALSFGNHRKYEAKKPMILYRVIVSFLDWVKDNWDTPESAFQRNSHGGPEAKFDALYHSLKSVFRFGRTGAFDLLCLLGNMGILPVRAGSCYLPGSTGPLKGARKLWGRRPPKELGRLADLTAQTLRIPFEVFEDALCMWQK
jgi:alpha-glutamyl/putrescinyl thymine pyrophosphorylase-like protein